MSKPRWVYSHPGRTAGEPFTELAFRAIDHIVLRVANAEPLFRLLMERLELPVVWPIDEAAFATFGWAGVGNTKLELWASSSNADIPVHVGPG